MSLKRKRYTREVKWGACIQRKRRRGLDNERSLPSLLSPFRVLSELVPALFRPCISTFQQKIPVWDWHRVVYLYKMMVFFIFYYSNENRQVKSDIKNVIYIRKKKSNLQTFIGHLLNAGSKLYKYLHVTFSIHPFTRLFQTGQSIKIVNKNLP